jgi:hypothetical protein
MNNVPEIDYKIPLGQQRGKAAPMKGALAGGKNCFARENLFCLNGLQRFLISLLGISANGF